MFQMNCSNCRGTIKSPFLAELSTITCQHCNEMVPVKDVLVRTTGFTMHRDDLINRVFRFQRLLKEVEKEMQLITEDKSASAVTQKSINQFYATLQELLAGARSSFRLEIPFDLPVVIAFHQQQKVGRLINLSSEGASFTLASADELPRKGYEITFQLTLPERAEPLDLTARVVWVKKPSKDAGESPAIVGVKFIVLDEKIRSDLWDFIVVTAEQLKQP